MANIPKVKVGNVEYDLKDAVAREHSSQVLKGTDGNIWDEEWTNGAMSRGVVVPGSQRILSSYIPVLPGIKLHTNVSIVVAFFTEGKSFISDMQYDIDVGDFVVPDKAYLMRFYTLSSYEGSYDPENNPIIISLSHTEKSDELLDQSLFVNGALDSQGRIASGVRILYPKFVSVIPGELLKTSQCLCIRYYDINQRFLSSYISDTHIGTFVVPDDAYFLRLYTTSEYDTSHSPQQYKNDIFITRIKERVGTPYNRIKVMAWNIHAFRLGTTTGVGGGCEQDQVATRLPLWKKMFIDDVSPDIIVFIEWWDKFDENGTIDAYEEIFKQFYPYKATVSNYVCLLSKVPMTFEPVTNGTNMILGTSKNGDLQVITWIQPNVKPASWREEKYQWLLNKVASPTSTMIVAGDFNNDAGPEELHVFTDAGYVLGNNGYWGSINTCDSTTSPVGFAAIDNIIVGKGIINHFEKIEDQITSDHNAVVADISY